MSKDIDLADLEEALRHAQAGIAALTAARDALSAKGAIYPTHLHLSAVELAHTVELAMRVALRNS